jgi:hypothetical protein
MNGMRLRYIILFLLIVVFITPIRAGVSTDYLLGGALTLKNGRIEKVLFDGGYAHAMETNATNQSKGLIPLQQKVFTKFVNF